MFDTGINSYELSTAQDGINGTGEQCLIYYYYMSRIGDKNITILKAERGAREELIDSVNEIPFNGWVERRVSYYARTPYYKVGRIVFWYRYDEIVFVLDLFSCTEDIYFTCSTCCFR